MNIGMLWFDNDPKDSIETKVERAVDYYQKKYNKKPNLCFVHPSMMQKTTPEKQVTESGVEIRSNRSVLPNHFWIGVNSGS